MAKFKKNWISGAIQHPGALTRKAQRAGMSVTSYIANPPKNITSTTKKQIGLAKTLRKIRRKKH